MQAFTKCVQVVGICRDSALRSRCPLLVVVGGIDHQAEEGCKWHACGTVKHSDTAFLEQCDITRDFWKITIVRLAAAKLQGAGSYSGCPKYLIGGSQFGPDGEKEKLRG